MSSTLIRNALFSSFLATLTLYIPANFYNFVDIYIFNNHDPKFSQETAFQYGAILLSIITAAIFISNSTIIYFFRGRITIFNKKQLFLFILISNAISFAFIVSGALFYTLEKIYFIKIDIYMVIVFYFTSTLIISLLVFWFAINLVYKRGK